MNKLFIVITILVSLVVISCSGDSTSTGMVAKDPEDEIVQSDNSVPSLQTGSPFKWRSGEGEPNTNRSGRPPKDPCDWKFTVFGSGCATGKPGCTPPTRVISYRKLRRKKALVVGTFSTGGYWGYGSWAYSTVVGALDGAESCSLSSCRTWDINGNVCNSKSKKRRLRVTTPNGRQKWRTGKQYDIIWSTGPRWGFSGPEKVKILLLKGNKAYQWISKSASNDGLYIWKIPDTLPRGSNYKIKISSITRKPVSDRSDRNFTIR